MKQEAEKAWNELQAQFDNRLAQIKNLWGAQLTAIDDNYRKANRDREERRFAYLDALRRERHDAADAYLNARREAINERNRQVMLLEQERQTAYREFKAAHQDEDQQQHRERCQTWSTVPFKKTKTK